MSRLTLQERLSVASFVLNRIRWRKRKGPPGMWILERERQRELWGRLRKKDRARGYNRGTGS